MKDDFLGNDSESYKGLAVVLSIAIMIFGGFMGLAVWLMMSVD